MLKLESFETEVQPIVPNAELLNVHRTVDPFVYRPNVKLIKFDHYLSQY